MKLLVADDSPLARAMVNDALTAAGFDVVLHENGQDALAELLQGNIRIAVLDWLMPDITGLEVCRELASRRGTAWTYIILLTGKSGDNDLVEALEAGASDFVRKPVSQHELVARVKSGVRIIELEQQLVQSQKLESLGQMAAGIAHEINTPLQFINDNGIFVRDGLKDLAATFASLDELVKAARTSSKFSSELQQIDGAIDWKETAYLLEELPAAISQSLDGISRVSAVTQAMRDFAKPATQNESLVDVNRAISVTQTLLQSKIAGCASVETKLDTSSPSIKGSNGDFCQILLSLVSNALDAIRDRKSKEASFVGCVELTTNVRSDDVVIQVKDNGSGIPAEFHERVYDPFFTTKAIGQGSGQGLATASQLVKQQFRGTIEFSSAAVGQGTVFTLCLPLASETVGCSN